MILKNHILTSQRKCLHESEHKYVISRISAEKDVKIAILTLGKVKRALYNIKQGKRNNDIMKNEGRCSYG